jgi:phosphohistidine phosphatase
MSTQQQSNPLQQIIEAVARDKGIEPDVIITSTAERARSTAALVAAELGTPARRVIADERLYAASAEEVLRVVGELDGDLSVAIVVGHNPEMASLAHRFSEEIHEMPTCAVAEYTFEVDAWYELEDAAPSSVWVDTPRS